MRHCKDGTGRFGMRPYYDAHELDLMCERVIKEIMEERCGGWKFPIPNDALTKLIERDADLDLYADLTFAGADVDGLTNFFPGGKPDVKINSELSGHDYRRHRYRTTLSHEYGHVMLHRGLFDGKGASPEMLEDLARKVSPVCKRDHMVQAPGKDWMEWQANHCSGALLMPITRLKKLVCGYFERRGIYGATLKRKSPQAGELIHTVSKAFLVSGEAARVRLDNLGYFADRDAPPSLFDA